MTHTRNTPASRKVSLAPDTRTMPARAARAWTERMAVGALGGGRYTVEGERGATYVVDLPERRCSCPDHAIREARCKHLRRVAIEITGRRIAPPGHRAAECEGCGRETFVTDETRVAVCRDCGFAAGDRARDRETGDRLTVVGTTDQRADEAGIPAANCTVAEYPTNRYYDPDEPVVEATYPTDGEAEPRRYSFPLSRLEPIEESEDEDRPGFERGRSALVAVN